MRISILPIGSELLDGRVVDTNSRYIGESITSLGGTVVSIVTVTDRESEILSALEFAESKSDVIILSGGLGPTTDDLTRESVRDYLKVKLLTHEPSLEKIKERFKKRGRPYEASNDKQAWYPEGGTIIENAKGTAPGFWIEKNKKLFIALPGVPSELYPMWTDTVIPLLEKRFAERRKIFTVGFKTIDLPESVVGAKIVSLNLPQTITVSYRANFPEIEVKLSSLHQSQLIDLLPEVIKEVGFEHVFTQNLSESFPEVVSKKFLAHSKKIATAESCTSGLLGKLLTDLPGSSSYYVGGVNSYSNAAKQTLLGVTEEALSQFGAVSAEVACQMAEGVRKKLNADIGVSITGIAGPDGGSEEKPVGLFYLGLSTASETKAVKHFYPGSRPQVRIMAAYQALKILRDEI